MLISFLFKHLSHDLQRDLFTLIACGKAGLIVGFCNHCSDLVFFIFRAVFYFKCKRLGLKVSISAVKESYSALDPRFSGSYIDPEGELYPLARKVFFFFYKSSVRLQRSVYFALFNYFEIIKNCFKFFTSCA